MVKSKDFFTPTLNSSATFCSQDIVLAPKKYFNSRPISNTIWIALCNLLPNSSCMMNAVTTKRISHISLVQQIGQIYRCNLQSLSVTIMTSHKLLCKISAIVPYYTTITTLATTESLLIAQKVCQSSESVSSLRRSPRSLWLDSICMYARKGGRVPVIDVYYHPP